MRTQSFNAPRDGTARELRASMEGTDISPPSVKLSEPKLLLHASTSLATDAGGKGFTRVSVPCVFPQPVLHFPCFLSFSPQFDRTRAEDLQQTQITSATCS